MTSISSSGRSDMDHNTMPAFVRVHQMAPPRTVVTTSSCSLLLIYRPRKDERLSRPGWLAYSGRFTHISDHPSAVGRAQDSDSSPVKDQRSTAEPRNQLSHSSASIPLNTALNWTEIKTTQPKKPQKHTSII